jgi:hypothetical protein
MWAATASVRMLIPTLTKTTVRGQGMGKKEKLT